MRIVIRLVFFFFAVVVSWKNPTAVGNAASEIVTYAAIVSAGAVSALIFSGTILGSRARARVSEAFDTRFWGEHHNYWFLMFLSASSCSILVIFGQIIDWTLPISFTLVSTQYGLDFGAVVAFLVIFSLGLATSLMLDFSKAIKDIMNIAAADAQARPSIAQSIDLEDGDVAVTVQTGQKSGE